MTALSSQIMVLKQKRAVKLRTARQQLFTVLSDRQAAKYLEMGQKFSIAKDIRDKILVFKDKYRPATSVITFPPSSFGGFGNPVPSFNFPSSRPTPSRPSSLTIDSFTAFYNDLTPFLYILNDLRLQLVKNPHAPNPETPHLFSLNRADRTCGWTESEVKKAVDLVEGFMWEVGQHLVGEEATEVEKEKTDEVVEKEETDTPYGVGSFVRARKMSQL
ncbi:hypothetical protein HDV00_012013 [Rhizophlyctis rosea]|nr:hypothetical protein HDV00_012013 [Rhizophlyctis rosea]